MKRTTLTLIAALAAFATFVPATASAQRGGWRNDHRRPAQVGKDWTVRPLVVRTERESNAFRAWFERSGSRRDRNLKDNVQKLDEALERLRSRASDGRPGVGKPELQRALNYARAIDRQINRQRQGRVTVREWNDLQRTLNGLARIYDVRGV